jgi:hypothetical protein
MQIVKYPQLNEHKYSLGAKGRPFNLKINISQIPYSGILLAVVDQVPGSGSALKISSGSGS